MKRLFTFGCSFTNYQWPTWADILSKDFDIYQNWGQTGAGNYFIYHSLIECHLKNSLTKNDTVGIMWSSCGREDRYIKGKWLTPGNIYNSPFHDKEYLEKWVDLKGFIMRDLALIHGATKILEQIGCRYIFLSMVPISYFSDQIVDDHQADMQEIFDSYTETLAQIKSPIFKEVFDNNWDSRQFVIPGEKSWWQRWYDKIKDPSWPILTNKTDYLSLSEEIKKECKEVFGFFIPNANTPSARYDYHPTPMEHLEYLDAVDVGPISESTREWAQTCDNKVRSGQYHWQNRSVQRW